MIQIEKRILVVNEDIAFCCAFQERMQNNHTTVICTRSEIKALDIFIKQKWCLVILDIQPSNKARMEMLRIMHSTKHIPILTLIPLLEKNEKIALFRAGADVCLDMETDIEICVAQAEALIQIYMEPNAEQERRNVIAFGPELIINPRCRQVVVDSEPLELTRKEFDLLYYLASHPEQVFSWQQLYRQVWNMEPATGDKNTIKVHIRNIRKKTLSAGTKYIHNVWGVGYKFHLESNSSIVNQS